MQNFQQIIQDLIPVISHYALQVLGAVVILIIGWAASNWFASRVRRWAKRSGRIDDTIVPIFATVTKVFVLIVTLLAVLNQFGVQTTSIVAVLGAAGLAIGLALQGTLTNIASGMMLLILRPIRVGDVVDIGGTFGVVDEIGIFITDLHTFDNIAISMPNSSVWGNTIKNYSKNDNRRVDMVFGISYDDSIDKAMKIIKEEIDKDERTLEDPPPMIAVSELGDNSVNLIARPWSHRDDFFQTKLDLTKRIKERFDEEDITIPFPQRDVHMYQSPKEA